MGMRGSTKWPRVGVGPQPEVNGKQWRVKGGTLKDFEAKAAIGARASLSPRPILICSVGLASWKKVPRAVAAHFGGHEVGWEIFLNALCAMGLMRKRGVKFCQCSFFFALS